MLAVRDLAVDIMGSRVLRGITFKVEAGELVCLVGRNGAGKTTTLRTIMGLRKPAAGCVEFDGRDTRGLRPFHLARAGIGFAPEESEVFGELTVAENIALPTWVSGGTRSARARIEEAYRVFPALERHRRRSGHGLSGGERKMSRSLARLRSVPNCCCSMSRRRGFRPSLSRQCSMGSPISANSAGPSSLPSPTSIMFRISPIGSMSSNVGKSSSPALRRRPARMLPSPGSLREPRPPLLIEAGAAA
jgi:branched-chain amino acid transport system ATP-binding protein